MGKVNLLKLGRTSILNQLYLEEALLRNDTSNWCILSRGNAESAIVLGVGGKPEVLVHEEAARMDKVMLIKRFTGGGTVFIDENTLFVSFIMNKTTFPLVEGFPRPIMKWSGQFYQTVLGDQFELRENDYCIGEKKLGGNAQSVTKDRWIHHTSFLWDFDEKKMLKYLKMPTKQPEYRNERSHESFLTRLKDIGRFNEPEDVLASVEKRLAEIPGIDQVCSVDVKEALKVMEQPHRRSTRVLSSDTFEPF